MDFSHQSSNEPEKKALQMIIVIASIEIADGKRDTFLEEFHKIVPLVREEKGCMEYGPTVDAETDIGLQQPLRPDVVVVVEKWESVSALNDHLGAPHMEEYRTKVSEIVRGMDLRILKPT